MEKRAFGKTGMQVSVLGFGGSEIGFAGAAPHTAKELVQIALSEDINVLDTAECYGNSEELLGESLGDNRKDFYLFTKCGHGGNYTADEWSLPQITHSIDRSLKRLKTDYLDLIQLHSPGETILKRGEAIEALLQAKQAGKTRFIGYSGDGPAAIYAINTGMFDTLQTSVSVADQEAIENLIPLAEKRGMGIIAKRPVANTAWKYKSAPSESYHEPYWQRLKKLKYDFVDGNLTETVAHALRFTLSVPGLNTAIVGTTKPERLRENARLIAAGNLSKSEYEAIRERWQEVATPDWTGQV